MSLVRKLASLSIALLPFFIVGLLGWGLSKLFGFSLQWSFALATMLGIFFILICIAMFMIDCKIEIENIKEIITKILFEDPNPPPKQSPKKTTHTKPF